MFDETNQLEINQKKRFQRKSGRTLVAKKKDNTFDSKELDDLIGLQNSTTTQNNAIFLTFDTKENALEALKHIKCTKKDKINIKFAHYKIFFKLDGLLDSDNYDEIKALHVEWIEKNSGGEILYYKLYRKNDTYLNCGDVTVDTKDAIDKLLSDDHHKNYKLNDVLSGTFYRYNRVRQDKKESNSTYSESI